MLLFSYRSGRKIQLMCQRHRKLHKLFNERKYMYLNNIGQEQQVYFLKKERIKYKSLCEQQNWVYL